MPDRDERVGAELRGLDVPDHGPEFFARLEQRLAQEPPAARRRRRPPMLLGGAAAAAVLAVVAASVVFTGDGSTPPLRPSPSDTRLISAGEVRSRVSTALSSLRSLRGEVAIECAIPVGDCLPPDAGGRSTLRWSFVTTAAGDERVTGIGRQDDVAYSAARREQRVLTDSRPAAQVVTNLPPGPPDQAARPSVLRRNVASVVRAFLTTTGEVPVTDVNEQARPAWRLVTPVAPNKLAGPGSSGDQLEVIVDQETGFPLRVTETLTGRFLHEVRLSNLVVDGPVDPASFTIEFPAGTQPFRQDAGFRALPLSQVGAVVGYQPRLPAPESLPPGFQLAEVTVATSAQGTGSEGANPQSRNVVSVAYRRGFDRIVVTTRSTGTARRCTTASTATCWADPLASGEGFRDEPERFTVGAGALAGAQAELVLSARGVPHVWTIDNRLVVTVAGDASGEELRRMAESFAPAG
ncbi:MAG: hypothetical protein M3163_09790 [Actinomycetota bacterium]|nr:hypothetical protein [Actinomycetota bacterium]